MAETNPNGANATFPDPRQDVCWEFYLESIAAGLPNAMDSALKACYEPTSARNITATVWFSDRLDGLRRKGMRSKAERNLDKILDIEWDKDGEIKSDVLRVVADVSHKTAKALGKDDWSERTEMTGKDGKELPTPILSIVAKKD